MRLSSLYCLPTKIAMVLLEQHRISKTPTIAVDLDGTLAKYDGDFDADKIGEPRKRIVRLVRYLKKIGCKIIIFTCRDNNAKIEEWLKEHDVPFDTVNANVDDDVHTSGKVLADVYLDDRGVSARHRTKNIKAQIMYLIGRTS